jgi:hypothetical protein
MIGVQEFRSSGVQEFRSSGVQEFRSSGVQEFRSSGWCPSQSCKAKTAFHLKAWLNSVSHVTPPELLNSCNS